jgi:hypothetical protein
MAVCFKLDEDDEFYHFFSFLYFFLYQLYELRSKTTLKIRAHFVMKFTTFDIHVCFKTFATVLACRILLHSRLIRKLVCMQYQSKIHIYYRKCLELDLFLKLENIRA